MVVVEIVTCGSVSSSCSGRVVEEVPVVVSSDSCRGSCSSHSACGSGSGGASGSSSSSNEQ